MEYFPDPQNQQVYADIAYRIGHIILEYDKQVKSNYKFESTLHLISLQNLLTINAEYTRDMLRKKNILAETILSNNKVWGISLENIYTTYHEKLTLATVLKRMRNSVSHPTIIDLDADYLSTGYCTIKDNSNIIKEFIFVDSIDVINGKLKQYDEKRALELMRQKRIKNLPADVEYSKEKQCLIKDGDPYYRIFKIKLNIDDLRELVLRLSEYLAQPIQANWDGITITELKNIKAA